MPEFFRHVFLEQRSIPGQQISTKRCNNVERQAIVG
jgi:hypothetical protein